MRLCVLPIILAMCVLSACTDRQPIDPAANYTVQLALLTPEQPLDGSVGRQYDTPLTFSISGVGPYRWTVTAGSLPPGLVLELTDKQQCRLYGTPWQTGVYTFTIEVDSKVGPLTYDRVVRIYPADSLLITTVSTPTGTAGINYGANVYATGGSGTGYSWMLEAGALPPGVSLDHRDGTLNWGGFTTSGNLDLSLGNGKLSRVSGLVASRKQPGVFWMHDDMVAGAYLFAVNANGDILQQYLLNTSRVDWEDIALGPGGGLDYIYIGDFGDDSAVRQDCRILRVPEPTVPVSRTPVQPLAPEEFWFTYPGGAQDCEALLIDRETGTPYLVEKTSGPPRVHRFPMPLSSNWNAASPVVLQELTTSGTFDGAITGGDASRDSRRIVLRSHHGLREYARPAGAPYESLFDQLGTPIAAPGGSEWEGVAYSGEGDALWMTSELAGQNSAPLLQALATSDNGYTTLSGLPTTQGHYVFTLRVTDSAGNQARRTFSIVMK